MNMNEIFTIKNVSKVEAAEIKAFLIFRYGVNELDFDIINENLEIKNTPDNERLYENALSFLAGYRKASTKKVYQLLFEAFGKVHRSDIANKQDIWQEIMEIYKDVINIKFSIDDEVKTLKLIKWYDSRSYKLKLNVQVRTDDFLWKNYLIEVTPDAIDGFSISIITEVDKYHAAISNIFRNWLSGTGEISKRLFNYLNNQQVKLAEIALRILINQNGKTEILCEIEEVINNIKWEIENNLRTKI